MHRRTEFIETETYHSRSFKAQCAWSDPRLEDCAQISAHHEVHATQVNAWKTGALRCGGDFGGDVYGATDGKERTGSSAKIARTHHANAFLDARSGNSPARRKAMIERMAKVPVKRGALLDLSRSSVYYVARFLPQGI